MDRDHRLKALLILHGVDGIEDMGIAEWEREWVETGVLRVNERRVELLTRIASALLVAPIPMILQCPQCRARHIDTGEFEHKPHHTHACQKCGFVWRPAIVATKGVRFLPGFKNSEDA